MEYGGMRTCHFRHVGLKLGSPSLAPSRSVKRNRTGTLSTTEQREGRWFSGVVWRGKWLKRRRRGEGMAKRLRAVVGRGGVVVEAEGAEAGAGGDEDIRAVAGAGDSEAVSGGGSAIVGFRVGSFGGWRWEVGGRWFNVGEGELFSRVGKFSAGVLGCWGRRFVTPGVYFRLRSTMDTAY